MGYGTLSRCTLKKGFAFVTFEEQSSADDATEGLQGKDLLGSPLFIEPAKSSRTTDRDSCFKCKQSGHWARDCPEGGGRSPRRYGGGRDSYRRDDTYGRSYRRRDDDRYDDRGDRGGDRGRYDRGDRDRGDRGGYRRRSPSRSPPRRVRSPE